MRFQAKACPGLDPGWKPVRVQKTRQIRNPEPRFDSIETGLQRVMRQCLTTENDGEQIRFCFNVFLVSICESV